jgi:3-dehydroquinate synthetase
VSANQKARIVEQDEKEMGIRATLNFGHTFGHALEKHFQYSQIKHGQAVLLGMKCAIDVSRKLKYLKDEPAKKMISLIDQFDVQIPKKLSDADISILLKLMQHDKKVKNEKVNYILIKDFGKVFKSEVDNNQLIRAAFESLN